MIRAGERRRGHEALEDVEAEPRLIGSCDREGDARGLGEGESVGARGRDLVDIRVVRHVIFVFATGAVAVVLLVGCGGGDVDAEAACAVAAGWWRGHGEVDVGGRADRGEGVECGFCWAGSVDELDLCDDGADVVGGAADGLAESDHVALGEGGGGLRCEGA
jgi:hypothetical protein